MQCFARHPRLVFLLLLAADGFAIWSMTRSREERGPEMAQWIQLCVMSLIFGPLCLQLPNILGGIHGPMDRGAWMNPTPGVIVTVIGWLFMITPVIVLLLQQFRD